MPDINIILIASLLILVPLTIGFVINGKESKDYFDYIGRTLSGLILLFIFGIVVTIIQR